MLCSGERNIVYSTWRNCLETNGGSESEGVDPAVDPGGAEVVLTHFVKLG